MRPDDPNLPHLRRIAEALGDLREQMVFVGGAVAGLLVTDPLADPVRGTRDVDAVMNAGRASFHRMEEAVAARGFARDVGSDVICRWVHKDSGVLFDLMPVQPEVLAFPTAGIHTPCRPPSRWTWATACAQRRRRTRGTG